MRPIPLRSFLGGRCTVRSASWGLIHVSSHFTATLNVRSSCAAFDTASRAFPYCPVSRYQLVQPLWTALNCSRITLRTFRRQAFAQAQEPFEPELTILKQEFHLVPFRAHSHVANFRGRSVEPDERTVDVTEAREHG